MDFGPISVESSHGGHRVTFGEVGVVNGVCGPMRVTRGTLRTATAVWRVTSVVEVVIFPHYFPLSLSHQVRV